MRVEHKWIRIIIHIIMLYKGLKESLQDFITLGTVDYLFPFEKNLRPLHCMLFRIYGLFRIKLLLMDYTYTFESFIFTYFEIACKQVTDRKARDQEH